MTIDFTCAHCRYPRWYRTLYFPCSAAATATSRNRAAVKQRKRTMVNDLFIALPSLHGCCFVFHRLKLTQWLHKKMVLSTVLSDRWEKWTVRFFRALKETAGGITEVNREINRGGIYGTRLLDFMDYNSALPLLRVF